MCVCVCVCVCWGLEELVNCSMLHLLLTLLQPPEITQEFVQKPFFFPPEVPTETWRKTAELVLVPGEIPQRSGGSTVAFDLRCWATGGSYQARAQGCPLSFGKTQLQRLYRWQLVGVWWTEIPSPPLPALPTPTQANSYCSATCVWAPSESLVPVIHTGLPLLPWPWSEDAAIDTNTDWSPN